MARCAWRRGDGMHGSAKDISGFYERHAYAFDAERSRSLFEKGWLERFTALVPAGGHILDLGCGMGEPIARYFVERGFSVTGIDASPAMIALCRARLPNQDWQTADMRELALKTLFGGVLAWDSFFHLSPDDQRGMFTIFRNHAAPAAPLMFTAGPDHGEAIGNLWNEPLYHASLAPHEYRSLLKNHGFAVVDHAVEDPGCDKRTVWLAQRNRDR
jgi:SAM-dependent methyltransferase